MIRQCTSSLLYNSWYGLHAEKVYEVITSLLRRVCTTHAPAHSWKRRQLLIVKYIWTHFRFVRFVSSSCFCFFSLVKVKFGEPADQDSQELFGLICQFVHDFKRAHAEIIWVVLYALPCVHIDNHRRCTDAHQTNRSHLLNHSSGRVRCKKNIMLIWR